jgi:hypothetical protein
MHLCRGSSSTVYFATPCVMMLPRGLLEKREAKGPDSHHHTAEMTSHYRRRITQFPKASIASGYGRIAFRQALRRPARPLPAARPHLATSPPQPVQSPRTNACPDGTTIAPLDLPYHPQCEGSLRSIQFGVRKTRRAPPL